MSEIQENLKAKNKEYADSFTKGHLALPPAKKYAVSKSHSSSVMPPSGSQLGLRKD
jgi:carbonic anhydrase